jgi:hypothetical protein
MFKKTFVAIPVGVRLAASAEALAQSGHSAGTYAPVSGLKMYDEIHGKANGKNPPLVLLHGGVGAIEMFKAQSAFREFEQKHKLRWTSGSSGTSTHSCLQH